MGSSSNSDANSDNSVNVPAQQWIMSNPSQKSGIIDLEANYNDNDGGMNFDGYSNGAMTVTVPKGWTVQVKFSNDSSMTVHSVMVVPFSDRTNSSFTPTDVAFKGAATPNAESGTLNGQTQTFIFTATKPGKYAIVCGIPGHAALGMWDTLVVSDTSTSISVSTK
ncbi:hypothetical protein JI721_14385 [Alicyclobacillus cycloheptanicus]|uniref:sulfocyanin-like copper-binding protein n=1 Tax=Alicyclobacillus cycloheptanicus TaxID=1457 RepID=UPI002798A65B|nr:sulfocyanin-like copper-binding protein [Alicyclobacillus cycloheptanicus]WDM00860.1 hypothetical protein JI721_14385 [Alicyclobacillus cycloheptanicus]